MTMSLFDWLFGRPSRPAAPREDRMVPGALPGATALDALEIGRPSFDIADGLEEEEREAYLGTTGEEREADG